MVIMTIRAIIMNMEIVMIIISPYEHLIAP